MGTPSKAKFLVFGSNGQIASTFAAETQRRGLDATYLSHLPREGQRRYDFLSDSPAQLNLSANASYVACIFSASTNIDHCGRQPEYSARLNVHAPKALLEAFPAASTVPVLISTDNVFDGRRGNYVETDPVNPLNLYGRQKVVLEEHIRRHFKRHLVIRISKAYDLSPRNVLMELATALRAGEPKKCFTDQIFAPIYVPDIVRFVLEALERGVSGTYHLAADQSLTRIDQARMLAEALGAPQSLVKPTTIAEQRLFEPRPPNASLLNGLAKATLGFRFTSYEEMVAAARAELVG